MTDGLVSSLWGTSATRGHSWWRRTLSLTVVTALLAGFLVSLGIVREETPAKAALSGLTTFEIDGNTVTDSPGDRDWLLTDGSQFPGAKVYNDKNWSTAGPQGILADIGETDGNCTDIGTDDIFVNGQKIKDAGGYNIKTGNASGKTDFCQVYTASETASNGDLVAYAAFTRRTTTGNMSALVEFNHSQFVPGPPKTPYRTAGDILLEIDFTGQATGTLVGHVWTGSAWSSDITIPTSEFQMAINPAIPNAPAGTFGEIALNMSSSGLLEKPTFPKDCKVFTHGLIYSFSGESSNSNLSDLGARTTTDISTCGEVEIKKATDPSGLAGTFPYKFATQFPAGGAQAIIHDFSDQPLVHDGDYANYEVIPGDEYVLSEQDPLPNNQPFALEKIICKTGDIETDVTGGEAFEVRSNTKTVCTITNVQLGTIIVEKVTAPDPQGPGDFTFTGDAAGTIQSGGQIKVPDLVPGTYTSTEDDPRPGFDLTGIVCDDPNSSGDVATRTATFEVRAGETVKCTFTNTQRGHIIVEKETLPDGSTQEFEFSPSWGDKFKLTDGGSKDSGALTPGAYSVSETVPPGWYLKDDVCSDGNPPDRIDLKPGETVTCTFTNIQLGTIIVEKQTLPNGSTQEFEFDPSWGAKFSLADNEQNMSRPLVPGTKSVSETVPPGWILRDDPCSDGSAPDKIKLDPGETVTCVFTNTQRGTIIVEKQTEPGGAVGDFTFTGDAAGTIQDGGQIKVPDLLPGTYTSTEADPTPGFDLTGIVCDDPDSSGDVGTRTATFVLDPGETVTCSFENTQRGIIVVQKKTLPSGSTQEFAFDTSWGDKFKLADGQAVDSLRLKPGTYSASETVPAGWGLRSATCDDGSTPDSIDLQPGETVTCTFTNSPVGTIIVEKQALPDGAPGDFTFTGDVAGTIKDGGQLTVRDAWAGTYHSTEDDPAPGFDLTKIVCDDPDSSGDVATRTATFVVAPGETVKCTFTNTQRGNIIVENETVPGGATQEFEFVPSWGDKFKLTDGQSKDSGALKPGRDYSVKENVPSGWNLTSATCGDGSRPDKIDLDPGETVTCKFVNTRKSRVIVEKQTDPVGGTGFEFDPSWGDKFTRDGGQSHDSGELQPAKYSVSEAVPSDWEQKSATCSDGSPVSAIALDAGEIVTCTFTNTYRVDSFKVTKVLDDKTGVVPSTTEYTVEVSCTYPAGYPKSGDIPGFSPLALTLTGGQTESVGPLPVGSKCAIDETNSQGAASVTVVPSKVVVGESKKPTTVVVTNTYKVGDLGITKVVDGAAARFVPDGTDYEVTAKCSFLGQNLPDRAVILITPGQLSQTITGLPAGAVCDLSETKSSGAGKVVVTPKQVTITADKGNPVKVTVTNTYDVGGLTITKVVTGGGADSAEGPFNFEVSCTFMGSHLTPHPEKAVISHPGGSVTVDGLPVGAECAVKELAPYGGADGPAEMEPGSVVIGSDGPVKVKATNKFTKPPVPPAPIVPAHTGSQWIGVVLGMGSLLLLLGAALLLATRRRRGLE